MPRHAVGDAIVMDALAAGSEDAMGVVYDRLATNVHAQAARLVGAASADDVVQETFERVWRNAARYDVQRGTLEAWVYRIARNVALGVLRRSHPLAPAVRLDPGDLSGESCLWPPGPPGPAEAAERHDVQAAVRSAVAALSAERRAVVEHMLDGFTLVQVAARLGVPEGTAKSRARAAYAELRVALAARGTA